MKKYVAECIGTFALVFCGTGSMIINDITNGTISHVGISITFGMIVMAMIYTFGHISGAHINPAVSIGFTITKKLSKKDLFPYMFAQIIGAILASSVLKFLFLNHEMLGTTIPTGSASQSFILEFILTFFLMLTILFVSQNEESKPFTGIVVGSVVMLECMFAGPICMASMNPARSIGPAFLSGHLEFLWLYIVAPIIGALTATFTFKYFQN